MHPVYGVGMVREVGMMPYIGGTEKLAVKVEFAKGG